MNVSIPGTLIGLALSEDKLQSLANWAIGGSLPPAPPFIKQMVVLQYAKVYGVKSFIETGTYNGSTTKLAADLGLQCKSVELSPDLYQNALGLFVGYPNVELFHGDSGEMLGRMVEHAEAPHLFWLDSHYSGDITARGSSDTPIAQELEQLLSYNIENSVILIDDIRDFGKGDYPTVAYLEKFVTERMPQHIYENIGDIFRITPRIALAAKIEEDTLRDKVA